MRAIQTFLPNPRLVQRHRAFVSCDPAKAWEAARHFDAGEIPWVRFLFDLRSIFDPNAKQKDRRVGVDQVAASNSGFKILQETPGSEVVVGSIGKFWRLDLQFADFTPENYSSLQVSGMGKLAWAISVEPCLNGSTVAFELRIGAHEEDTWKRFLTYFHIIGPFSHLIRGSFMSHLEASLGKSVRPNDQTRELAGDSILGSVRYQLTHAIDIEAPPALVWPYLMQMGCDRGGWYSIDALDHGGEPSVDRIVAGWESRKVGDKLAATPAQDSFYDVYQVDPGRAFVIGGETTRLGGPFKMTWAFILEPLGSDATHLVVRARMTAEPRWSEWLQGRVFFPPIHAIMQGAQLKNLKRIGERDAEARCAS